MAISTRSAFSCATTGLMLSSCFSSRTSSKKNLMLGHIKGMRCGIWKLINSDGKSRRLTHGPLIFGKGYPKKQLLLLATAESLIQSEEDSVATPKEEKLDFLPGEAYAESKSSGELCAERSEGKPGFVSFYATSYGKPAEIGSVDSSKAASSLVWFVGPAVLVASLVFPSLYLRKILSMVFEDSLLTDFLILFFTEALFYGGVAIFLLLIDHMQRPSLPLTTKNSGYINAGVGVRISSVATLVLSLIIPLVTMGLVWPWTGPAASATLAPYLVGIVVQFAFEKYVRYHKSPAWLVIPVIFQVYRLHQLNRAAQLVTALSFSVRGAETTPQTLAINSSLGTLFNVLQFLGVICIWSIASFLMRFFPSSAVTPDL